MTLAAVPSTETPIDSDRDVSALFSPMEKWAVVVGISRFADKEQLLFGAQDALDFANFLIKEEGFAQDHVVLLADKNATRAKIRDGYGENWLPRASSEGDLVVVYISSHGSDPGVELGGNSIIYAYDTIEGLEYSTGTTLGEMLLGVSNALKDRRSLVIIDTCHSGPLPEPQSSDSAKKKHGQRAIDSLAESNKCFLVTSCASNQRSYDSGEAKNSIFTRSLIDILQSNNGKGISSVFDQIVQRVKDESRTKHRCVQSPELGKGGADLDIALAAKCSKPRQTPDNLKARYEDCFLPKAQAAIGASAMSGPEPGMSQAVALLKSGAELESAGRLREAESKYWLSLRLLGSRHDPSNLLMGYCHERLGTVLTKEKSFPSALRSYWLAVQFYEKEAGSDSVEVAQARSAMATALTEEGNYEQAKAQLELALGVRLDKLPESDIRIGQTYQNLGSVCLSMQDFDSAKKNFVRAADYSHGIDTDSGRLAYGVAMTNLGRTIYLEGDKKKSVEPLVVAKNVLSRSGPKGKVDLGKNQLELARVWSDLGHKSDAREVYNHAINNLGAAITDSSIRRNVDSVGVILGLRLRGR